MFPQICCKMDEIILCMTKLLSHTVMINIYSNPQFAVEIFLALAVSMVNLLLVFEVNGMFLSTPTNAKMRVIQHIKECPSKVSYYTGCFGVKDQKSVMSTYKRMRKNTSFTSNYASWALPQIQDGDAFMRKLMLDDDTPKIDKLEVLLSVTPSEYIRRDKEKLLHASHLKDCLTSLTQILDKQLDGQSRETLMNNIDSVTESLNILGFTDPARLLQRDTSCVDETLYDLMENIVLGSSLDSPMRLNYKSIMDKKSKLFDDYENVKMSSNSLREKRSSSVSPREPVSKSFNSNVSSNPSNYAEKESVHPDEEEIWWSNKKTPCTSQSELSQYDAGFEESGGATSAGGSSRRDRRSNDSEPSKPSSFGVRRNCHALYEEIFEGDVGETDGALTATSSRDKYPKSNDSVPSKQNSDLRNRNINIESTLAFILSEWQRKETLRRLVDHRRAKTDEIDRVLSMTPSGYVKRDKQIHDIKTKLLQHADGGFFYTNNNLEDVKRLFKDVMVHDHSKLWELDFLDEGTLYDFLQSVGLPHKSTDKYEDVKLRLKRDRSKLPSAEATRRHLKLAKSHDSIMARFHRTAGNSKRLFKKSEGLKSSCLRKKKSGERRIPCYLMPFGDAGNTTSIREVLKNRPLTFRDEKPDMPGGEEMQLLFKALRRTKPKADRGESSSTTTLIEPKFIRKSPRSPRNQTIVTKNLLGESHLNFDRSDHKDFLLKVLKEHKRKSGPTESSSTTTVTKPIKHSKPSRKPAVKLVRDQEVNTSVTRLGVKLKKVPRPNKGTTSPVREEYILRPKFFAEDDKNAVPVGRMGDDCLWLPMPKEHPKKSSGWGIADFFKTDWLFGTSRKTAYKPAIRSQQGGGSIMKWLFGATKSLTGNDEPKPTVRDFLREMGEQNVRYGKHSPREMVDEEQARYRPCPRERDLREMYEEFTRNNKRSPKEISGEQSGHRHSPREMNKEEHTKYRHSPRERDFREINDEQTRHRHSLKERDLRLREMNEEQIGGQQTKHGPNKLREKGFNKGKGGASHKVRFATPAKVAKSSSSVIGKRIYSDKRHGRKRVHSPTTDGLNASEAKKKSRQVRMTV